MSILSHDCLILINTLLFIAHIEIWSIVHYYFIFHTHTIKIYIYIYIYILNDPPKINSWLCHSNMRSEILLCNIFKLNRIWYTEQNGNSQEDPFNIIKGFLYISKKRGFLYHLKIFSDGFIGFQNIIVNTPWWKFQCHV